MFCLQVPAVEAVDDWERWVRSRVGTPPPPSDLQLLQEYYAHDAWQLLVACVLMSRVSVHTHAWFEDYYKFGFRLVAD